ncbi:DHA2 family efflux MFS transporter permease subunit [Streptomyces afghaniensis]|uniref:MFS transporter n=1 Tax=Streptomyces afghaniensis TaxID=66865 RepID=UPI0033A06886
MTETAAVPEEAAPTSPPGGLTHRQILTILSGLLLGMFLAALDQTIVSTAIRTISDDLHGLSQQAWATTAYLITSTITTPLYGKLSDLHGRKPYFLTAISIFVVGSAACSFATSMTELAWFRAFQGLGAGGLMSLVLAIIGDIVPPRERARYQGYLLATFATSSVLGPLIGGFLSGRDSILGIAGWRWVFLVNVPVGLLALAVVAKVLNVPHTRLDRRIDVWGAVTIALGVVPLLLVAEQGRDWGWTSTKSVVCYAVAAVGLLLWVLVERRVGDDALIPVRLFRKGMFSLVSVVLLIVGMGMFGAMMMIPQYLQIVKGATPTTSGLQMLPLVIGMMSASIVSGQVTSRTGRYKFLPIVGTALMVVALLLFAVRVDWDTPLRETMIYMLVLGLGLGCCMQTLVLAMQNAVPPQDMGVASASSTFFRQMGGTAGTAVFTTLLFTHVPGKIADAFTSVGRTASFQAALRDPAVRADPANRPVLDMVRGHGSSGATQVLSDSSFIQKLDPRLAVPFKMGFADSMHVVFLTAAAVLVLGFLLVLFIKEVPLRQVSGLQARAAEEGAAAPDSALVEKTPVDAGKTPVDVEKRPVDVTKTPVEKPRAEKAAASAQVPAPARSEAEPSAGGIPVHGFVRRTGSAPVPRAAVTLISLGGRQLGRAVARADGAYAVTAPGTGSYVLIASADGFQPQASTVVVHEDPVAYDILLSGTSGLSGVVRAAETSLPVKDAMVIVTDVRGDLLATQATGEQGEFSFGEVAAGTVTVAVNAAGFRPRALPVEIGGSGATRIEVDLDFGAHLQGIVRSPHGPLADARVTLVDAAGNVVGTAVTESDGAYAFTDLDSGEYTVIATGYPPVATALTVSGRGVDGHDMELSHPAE